MFGFLKRPWFWILIVLVGLAYGGVTFMGIQKKEADKKAADAAAKAPPSPYAAIANGKADVAIVGMRVQPHTRAAEELRAFFARQGIPAVATLRATQLYPRLALLGQTIFDVNESLARRELEDWQPLLDWLARD